MDVSVIICTWNRASILDRVLEQMAKLEVPSNLRWELLVANNNSSDATDEVIAHHGSRLPVRGLLEPRQGKSFAANRAVNTAQGNLLIWADDDIFVRPDWIMQYVNAARSFPEASFFGGAIEVMFEAEPPQWIGRYLAVRGPYGGHLLGDDVRWMTPQEAPLGGNMAMRASVLRDFSFDSRLGRFGEAVLPAEDGELFARMKQAGHRGVWVGPARVRHFVPADRLTSRYVWNWYRSHGRTLVLRGTGEQDQKLFGMPRWALRRFVEARLASILLLPFRNEAWVKAYTESARMMGVMQQAREALRTAQAPHA
ncbi:MAG: glycosyltransferase [Candidatus Korobacteraceae bacterium]